MKLILCILFMLIISITLSLGQSDPTRYQPELYIKGADVTEYEIIYYCFELRSNSWCWSFFTPDTGFVNCEECNNPNYIFANCVSGEAFSFGSLDSGNYGWDICNLGSGNHNSFGWGLYKLSLKGKEDECYFYIDFRDAKYTRSAYNENDPTLYTTDCLVKYFQSGHENNGNFSFALKNALDKEVKPQNGELSKIWLVYDHPDTNPTANTADFPNYWQNSLAFIDQNSNPYLFWQQDDGTHGVTNYTIKRKYN
ncbi:MAG: hypothetical protein V1720_01060 [bacterium]